MAMMIVKMAMASFVILISFCITGGKAEECQPPTGVMAEAVGADRVHVTWEEPPDRNCRIGFRVSFTPENGRGTLTAGLGISVYNYTVLGLHCNTAYIFKVGSVTHDGITVTWSEGVRALAGGPRNFSATVVSPTSVRLTWEPPASPCDESTVGYEVTYTCSECGMPANGSSPALTGVEYTFYHLEEDTEYCFRLRAAEKDFTDPVSVRTLTGGTGVVTGNTDTSSESVGAGEITVTLLVTAAKTASHTSPASHTTGEQLPTPTDGSPTSASGVSPEQQCSSCWPVAGGVIAVTVVVETVIVTVLTIAILYMWRSHHKLKQQQIKRPPDISVMECVAYGEIKPEPPQEAIYEEPQ